MKAWRAIPLSFRFGVIALMCSTTALLLAGWGKPSFEVMAKLQLSSFGLAFIYILFVLVGALELSKLLVGRASLGAKIVAAGFAGTLACTLISVALRTKESADFTIYEWSWYAAVTAADIGLALMMWRRPVIAIAVLVLLFAIDRPPVLEHWLVDQLRDHREAYGYVRSAQRLLHALLLLVAALVAVADLPDGFTMPEPQRARIGLERMAASMWLRIFGLIVLPLLTFMLVVGDGHGAEKILGYGMMFGTGLGILSLAWFGIGALEVARSHHEAVRRWSFVAAAALASWCAGVTLQQIPDLYGAIHGRSPSWGREFGTLFPYLLPIAGACSIIGGALAISGFVSRRGHLELGERGLRTAIVVAIMQLFSMGITVWCLPEARSTSSLLLLTLMALVCGLVAIVSMAHLARDAAYAVEAPPPELPNAQLL